METHKIGKCILVTLFPSQQIKCLLHMPMNMHLNIPMKLHACNSPSIYSKQLTGRQHVRATFSIFRNDFYSDISLFFCNKYSN